MKQEDYLTENVDNQISALETALHRNLAEDLELNREGLNYILADAIAPRYGFRRAAIASNLRYNEALQKAIEIITNSSEYKNILSPSK